MTPSAAAVIPQEPPALQSDRDWMRDRVVIHKMVVALHAPHPALSDLLDQIARTHGLLQALNVRPLGFGFEAVLHVTRLSPEAAYRLADQLTEHPQVASASIEHMLVR